MTGLHHVRVTGHQPAPDNPGACTCGWAAPEILDGQRLTLSMRQSRLRDHKLDQQGAHRDGNVIRIYFREGEPLDVRGETVVTAVELAQQAGISYRQLDHWQRTHRLHCINPEVGNGHTRYYTPDEVTVARYTRRLLDAGVQLDTALHTARQLAAGLSVTLADGLITIKELA